MSARLSTSVAISIDAWLPQKFESLYSSATQYPTKRRRAAPPNVGPSANLPCTITMMAAKTWRATRAGCGSSAGGEIRARD